MARPTYVELGARSAFSFLEGASLPEDLAARAAELELPALAVTDFGGVYGSARVHHAALLRGLRAIVGARLEVEGVGWVRLLCESRAGYKNLTKLLTLGHAGKEKGRCAVTTAEAEAHAGDLTCLAGPGLGKLDPAPINILKRIYSKHLAIEVSRHLDRAETVRTTRLFALAEHGKLPAVATNDVRHARATGKPLTDVLTCIKHHTTVDRAGRLLLPNTEWRLKSGAEMQALFRDRPDAVMASVRIAERCAFGLEDLGYRFPDFPVEPGETQASTLHRLTFDGARGRYRPLSKKVLGQLHRELDLICKLELEGYFLIVHDIVDFARQQGILAQGRGSAANSAVCYALGITAVDPVGMGLLFERFLSEERGEWPDIDIDLPSGDDRERVIQYVYKRYGPHGAAMTANVITYRERSAIREVGKALGFSPEQVDRAARLGGRWSSIQEPGELAERMRALGLTPEERRVQLWMQLAGRILNLPRHLGQHSGGMVIAAGRLDEVTPIEPAAMPGRSVVQWDKDDCAQLGIIKVDLLGLGMLAALAEAVPMINAVEGVKIDYAHLPQNDPAIYDMLCRADTVGLFQVESRAQMATLPRLKPRCFYDLVVEIALIRPGPITGQMVHPYLRRRRGAEAVTYPHPDLQPVLERTLGVPIFQEQVMRMAMVIAGFTGGEAEELRRAMGFKRSTERMEDIEARLRAGMQGRGVGAEAQEQIIRNITSFAAYGFPESHSASFALIAYASAYLKAHHPAAFLTALLNAYPMGFYHPATLVKDAQRHGVHVQAIDVTVSDWRCTLESKESVRLGLRYVVGLREESAGRLIEARAAQPFTGLADLERRARLADTELATLAEIGAFAALGRTRRQALWQVGQLKNRTEGLLGHIEPEDASPLEEMSLWQRISADYRGAQVSAGAHPMRFLRAHLRDEGVLSAEELRRARDGSRVTVAGAVITRQRPGSAKGFFFITLEDETGFSNLIITPDRFDGLRQLVVGSTAGSSALKATGIVQNQEGVVHVRVEVLATLQVPADVDQIELPPARDGGWGMSRHFRGS